MLTTVGGHWELRAAALLKAVQWGVCLASLLTHLFFVGLSVALSTISTKFGSADIS